MDPADAPDTVTEALVLLRDEGYPGDFDQHGTEVMCSFCGASSSLEPGVVERIYRFEGPSDPGDEAIVLGVRCGNCGASFFAFRRYRTAGQSATARFSPTAVKCDSSIGDSTAISRLFAPSSPPIQRSIWSRRGKRPPSDISVQCRNTRQTSRRSSFILSVRLAGLLLGEAQAVRGTLNLH